MASSVSIGNPLCSVDEIAFARASGAQDILQKITIEDTLEDAIKLQYCLCGKCEIKKYKLANI